MKYFIIFLLSITTVVTSFSQITNSTTNWSQEIKQRVERGDDINFRDSLGMTFILKACSLGDLKTAEYLINKGANTNIADTNGTTILMYAAASGNVSLAQMLINKGTEYLCVDKKGLSALQYAEKSNNEKMTKLIKNYITPIKWISITEAEELCKKEPRKIIVDVYTDWCGWCKIMDQKTFSNPYISNYISKNFYAVKYNAESTENVTFNGKTYSNPSPDIKKSTNQFANYLLKGKLAYPSLVFINSDLSTIQFVQGYKKIQEMETLLHYFNTGAYKEKDFQVFKSEYISEIKGTVTN